MLNLGEIVLVFQFQVLSEMVFSQKLLLPDCSF